MPKPSFTFKNYTKTVAVLRNGVIWATMRYFGTDKKWRIVVHSGTPITQGFLSPGDAKQWLLQNGK